MVAMNSSTSTPLVTPSSENRPSVSESSNHQPPQSKGAKLVYLQSYFVTIATILGTGILGLPVTLASSGLYPFLVSFLGGYIIQGLLIYFFTDLLQRAHAIQLQNNRSRAVLLSESVPLNDIAGDDDLASDLSLNADDFGDLQDEHESNKSVLAGHVILPRPVYIRSANLHLLGELFLVWGVRHCFNIIILLHFTAFLISYSLAGSQAYAQVLGVDFFYVIPVFVWVLSLAVVFVMQIIQPVVSLLTFIKGSLLLATVVITFLVGAGIHHEIHNDFRYVGEPFLMGTVALGGVINVMPFLYGKVKPVRNQVSGYRNAIVLGLSTCMVINILWCWAVLDIVPQKSCETGAAHVSPTATPDTCNTSISLEGAASAGQISTIPLTQIIHANYPSFSWVAWLVELFIVISITVSFLTFGAALHHTLSGWVDSFFSQDQVSTYTHKLSLSTPRRCPACCHVKCIAKCAISLLIFTLVFIVAMLNPKSFVPMLEKAGSLVANLEAGLFVFLMVQMALNKDNRNLKIPLPMSKWSYQLQYLIPIYFGFAVIYDVYTTVLSLLHRSDRAPWSHTATNHSFIQSSIYTGLISSQNFSHHQ